MKYTESHEWIKIDQQVGRVGVSSYAQQELGDVVYVQLPKVGEKVMAGQEVAVLESTKAAADIYSPVSGEIVTINQKLLDNIGLLNTSPEQEGWLFEIAPSDTGEMESLLSEEQYHQMIT